MPYPLRIRIIRIWWRYQYSLILMILQPIGQIPVIMMELLRIHKVLLVFSLNWLTTYLLTKDRSRRFIIAPKRYFDFLLASKPECTNFIAYALSIASELDDTEPKIYNDAINSSDASCLIQRNRLSCNYHMACHNPFRLINKAQYSGHQLVGPPIVCWTSIRPLD